MSCAPRPARSRSSVAEALLLRIARRELLAAVAVLLQLFAQDAVHGSANETGDEALRDPDEPAVGADEDVKALLLNSVEERVGDLVCREGAAVAFDGPGLGGLAQVLSLEAR